MKKILIYLFTAIMLLSLFAGCSSSDYQREKSYTLSMSDEEIDEAINTLLERMTLEEKAAQMVQGEMNMVNPDHIAEYGLGSVLSSGDNNPGSGTQEEWIEYITSLQDAAMYRENQIPIIYGIDAVHGHSHVLNPIIFPHSIGLGAANDTKLMAEMGKIVAEEIKATSIHWNFAPCVACALDPRWGRTYESFSSDVNITADLALPFAISMQNNGVAACAKHYIGDGGTEFESGTNYLIDQGDVVMSEDELRDAFLLPYEQLVNEGVLTVMASFSSFNGLKMHQHEYLLNNVLKDELGFKGLVISDWEGHRQISADTYDEQVALAINSGIDMLMEPNKWKEAISSIVKNVNEGNITIERIDDAVYRILWVKFQIGLFDNPYPSTDYEIRSQKNIDTAIEIVEKSCVLLKNDDKVLPIKNGTKVFVTGPALDNIGVQCGGWSKTWQGTIDRHEKVTEGTTLLEGLLNLSEDKSIEIITDESRISEADLILISIGETPYAEGMGDSADISITGRFALSDNKDAIKLAQKYDLPVVTVIMAGRNVIIDEYVADWDALVMAYLPGTEGQGLANLIMGEAKFTAKLAMPWYKSVDDIKSDDPELLFDIGDGLKTR